jgi:hypothetical protein
MLGDGITKTEVFNWLFKNYKAGHLLGCSNVQSGVVAETADKEGILANHAYAILAAENIEGNNLVCYLWYQ